jgi:hypothetical protein
MEFVAWAAKEPTLTASLKSVQKLPVVSLTYTALRGDGDVVVEGSERLVVGSEFVDMEYGREHNCLLKILLISNI